MALSSSSPHGADDVCEGLEAVCGAARRRGVFAGVDDGTERRRAVLLDAIIRGQINLAVV